MESIPNTTKVIITEFSKSNNYQYFTLKTSKDFSDFSKILEFFERNFLVKEVKTLSTVCEYLQIIDNKRDKDGFESPDEYVLFMKELNPDFTFTYEESEEGWVVGCPVNKLEIRLKFLS